MKLDKVVAVADLFFVCLVFVLFFLHFPAIFVFLRVV